MMVSQRALVAVSPSLQVHFVASEGLSKCQLVLRNVAGEPILWKLHSNCAKLYRVCPNDAELAPESSVTVDICMVRRLTAEMAAQMDGVHKFRLEARIPGGERSRLELPVTTALRVVLPVCPSMTMSLGNDNIAAAASMTGPTATPFRAAAASTTTGPTTATPFRASAASTTTGPTAMTTPCPVVAAAASATGPTATPFLAEEEDTLLRAWEAGPGDLPQSPHSCPTTAEDSSGDEGEPPAKLARDAEDGVVVAARRAAEDDLAAATVLHDDGGGEYIRCDLRRDALEDSCRRIINTHFMGVGTFTHDAVNMQIAVLTRQLPQPIYPGSLYLGVTENLLRRFHYLADGRHYPRFRSIYPIIASCSSTSMASLETATIRFFEATRWLQNQPHRAGGGGVARVAAAAPSSSSSSSSSSSPRIFYLYVASCEGPHILVEPYCCAYGAKCAQ